MKYKPLWMAGNGAITCERDAGVTAQSSGMKRDLEGRLMLALVGKVAEECRAEWQSVGLGEPRCETCGAAMQLVTA